MFIKFIFLAARSVARRTAAEAGIAKNLLEAIVDYSPTLFIPLGMDFPYGYFILLIYVCLIIIRI